MILDLVMNHTSDQHRWFQSSRAGPDRPVRGLVSVARPGRRRTPTALPLPPNNWVSFFGGPGWQWEPSREQFYFHTFLAEQPELDWRTPAVEAAQFAMVRGWLARGVDGFRLDVFNVFLKDPGAAIEPGPARHHGLDAPGPHPRSRPARPARR